eukprot:s2061_g5.t1
MDVMERPSTALASLEAVPKILSIQEVKGTRPSSSPAGTTPRFADTADTPPSPGSPEVGRVNSAKRLGDEIVALETAEGRATAEPDQVAFLSEFDPFAEVGTDPDAVKDVDFAAELFAAFEAKVPGRQVAGTWHSVESEHRERRLVAELVPETVATEWEGDQLPQLDLVELRVCGLGGEELMRKKLPAVCTGQEVRKMVAEKLPSRPGAKCLLYQGVSQLMLDKTLQEQGRDISKKSAESDVWGKLQPEPAGEGVTFPSTLQSLTFGDYFDKNLEGVTFPSTLQSLTFGRNFNQKLKGMTFPRNMPNLTFGDGFNQKLEGVNFPTNLQSLSFGSAFNQRLKCVTLPNNLQSLTFGTAFNQNLQGVTFPSNLQSLTFGTNFNQNLEGATFPSTLQSLTFGTNFNQNLEGVTFPRTLQTLTFGFAFNQNLDSVTFPSTLQSLTFGRNFNLNLKRVTLPSDLQSLTFGDQFNLNSLHFLSNLQSLTFGDGFNQNLEGVTFPSNLQSLATNFNQNLEGVTFPSNLQSLTLGLAFNRNLEGVFFPSTLQSLTFGFAFNQNLDSVTFPSTLQSLTFGRNFNQDLQGVTFPSNLQSLTFGTNFNQNLEGVTFPSNLQSLTLGLAFKQNLERVTFPSSLGRLVVQDVIDEALPPVPEVQQVLERPGRLAAELREVQQAPQEAAVSPPRGRRLVAELDVRQVLSPDLGSPQHLQPLPDGCELEAPSLEAPRCLWEERSHRRTRSLDASVREMALDLRRSIPEISAVRPLEAPSGAQLRSRSVEHIR